METIKPKKLQKGDVVGIVSPSSPILPELKKNFEQGVKTLEEEFGLKVKYTERIFDKYFYNAGTREARIKEFNEVWADPEVKMVLMSLGGHTANHLLDGIDYEMIKNNPKIFAGISDGTTLLNPIFTKTGLITYHGPDLIFTFGQSMTQQIKENIWQTFFTNEEINLQANKNWVHQENSEIKNPGWRTVRSGKASGVLVGGHLGSLCDLINAGYSPEFEDKILFLEGTEEDFETDSQLTRLKLAGVFEKINGIILGWFEDFAGQGYKNRRPVKDILLEVTKNYDFPILEISDLGHNVENYVFPIGAKAVLDVDKKEIKIYEKNN